MVKTITPCRQCRPYSKPAHRPRLPHQRRHWCLDRRPEKARLSAYNGFGAGEGNHLNAKAANTFALTH
jgi:hypothetical protein